MKRETKQILTEILENENDKDVCNALLHLLDHTGKLSNLSSDNILSTKPIDYDKDKENIGKFHDYRLNWISFKNFRSIPFFNDKKPYGLSFENNDGNPISIFLVGRNSSGKTTVFSALEWHYVSDNSLSNDMDLKKSDILTYGFCQINGINHNNVRLYVKTVDGDTTEDFLSNQTVYCSPAPFCSDYDLHQLGNKGNDLRAYILSQLGYEELASLKDRLNNIKKEKQDDLKYNKNESDLNTEDYNEVIKHLVRYSKKEVAKTQLDNIKPFENIYNRDVILYQTTDGSKIYLFRSYWDRLRTLSSNIGSGGFVAKLDKTKTDTQGNSSEKSSQELTEKIKLLYDKFEEGLKKCSELGEEGMLNAITKLYQERVSLEIESGKKSLSETEIEKTEKVIAIIISIINKIEEKEKAIIEQFKTERFIMLKEILKIFSNNDGELFIKEWEKLEDKEKLTIMIRKQTEKGDFEATPQEFFNSFRYKLYAVSFKIALAFMEMKLKNIRVPIVIDDVFNASDFENNIRLEYFVHNIYLAYSSMNFKEPLQLIMLTHDEMVQAAFRKGANMIIPIEQDMKRTNENGEEEIVSIETYLPPAKPNEFRCGRLFNWNHAKKIEEKQKYSNEKDIMKISDDFYNLYIIN